MKYKYKVGERIQFKDYSYWSYTSVRWEKRNVKNTLTTGVISERHSYIFDDEKKDTPFYMVHVDGEYITAHVDGKDVIGVIKNDH